MSEKRPHPHFDDKGALDWHTSFAEALATARASGKKIFIELGRELCSQCRSLVQGVVPRSDVAPVLREHFVALAADADDPEPEVVELAQRLEGAMMLPFVIFADAEGRFLTGYSGTTTPPYFLRTLNKLVGKPAPENR